MYMQNGLILGVYRILGIATALIGLSGVLNDTDEEASRNSALDPSRSINIYAFLLPVAAFVYDFSV